MFVCLFWFLETESHYADQEGHRLTEIYYFQDPQDIKLQHGQRYVPVVEYDEPHMGKVENMSHKCQYQD